MNIYELHQCVCWVYNINIQLANDHDHILVDIGNCFFFMIEMTLNDRSTRKTTENFFTHCEAKKNVLTLDIHIHKLALLDNWN